ncbi:MAG: cell wall-binding protein [SAR324 cluster bacterium]|nr:cell wall-binding protein [SAR324 cluster bacterium]
MNKIIYIFILFFFVFASLISCSKNESESKAVSSSLSCSNNESESKAVSNPQLFNVVGYSGTILNSKDGISWQTSTLNTLGYGPSSNLSGIAYGANTFLAVGWWTTIVSSSDGYNWVDKIDGNYEGDLWRQCGDFPCIDRVELTNATYANNNFVVVGWNGNILSSPGGTIWTQRWEGSVDNVDCHPIRGCSGGDYLSDVTCGKDLFVVVGNGTVLTSSDLDSWTQRVNVFDWERLTPASNFLSAVTFGNNIFVTVGWSGRILTSPDGIQWTERSSGTSNNLKDVIFENGSFLVVGNSGTMLSSKDGISWVERSSGTSKALNAAAYGNNTYVVVGELGTIITSPDGTTWTERDSGKSNYLRGITFSR